MSGKRSKGRSNKKSTPRSEPAPPPSQARPSGSKRWLVAGIAVLAVGALALFLTRGQPEDAAESHDESTARNRAREAPGGAETRVTALLENARRGTLDEPQSAGRWGRLAAVLDAHERREEADEAYARAAELDPSEFRWPYDRACNAALLGRSANDVLVLLERARSIDPSYLLIDWRIGSTLLHGARHEEAAVALRRSLELHPDLAWSHRDLARALIALGRGVEAERHLERATALLPPASAGTELEPPDPLRAEVASLGVSEEHFRERAARSLAAGRFDAALAELRIVAETSPESGDVRLQMAEAHAGKGEFAKAIEFALEAARVAPESGRAHAKLGLWYFATRDPDQALTHYRRAVKLDPSSLEAHAGAAMVLAQTMRLPEAVECYEQAERATQLDAAAYTNWAVALSMLGQDQAAFERCQRAIELDPGYAQAHNGLGFIAQKLGRAEEALEHHRRAIELEPAFADAYYNVGALSEEFGRLEEALEAYRVVLQLAPNHPAAKHIAQLEARVATLGTDGEFVPQRPEFLRIAERLYASEQKYLGRAAAARLEQQSADQRLPIVERVEVFRQLARELLELGREDAAAEAIEQAFALFQSVPTGQSNEALLRTRALVHLRRAEVANCLQRSNSDCCIFPLAGGGVHAEREPAEKAWEAYRAYLEAQPGDLRVRWLLNVVAMALGRYPDDVPEALRIPPASFASGFDIGRFRNVAKEAGVDALNLCGGTIVDDFDGDGLLDIVTSTADPALPLTFYSNRGGLRFEDRSASARTDDQLGGLNCVGGDYDGDGDVDVLVLRGAWLLDDGRIRNSLLRNDGGVFRDVTRAAGLALPAFPTQAAAWADFDGDGDLDLYVANESRRELGDSLGDFPSQLFVNQGDGTFRDVAKTARVTNDRYAKGLAVGDYDDDGDIDIYVSNNGPNRLYRNEGGLRFTDVTREAGVIEPDLRSFASWFFDYDNDGRLDLFVGAFQANLDDVAADHLGLPTAGDTPRLYRNRGDGTFEDMSAAVGLDHMYLPMGANFGDLDNDGWLDIYLATGDPDFETLVPNVMLRNDRGLRFQDVTSSGGFGHLQKGHGLAFADLDDDGDQDIYHQLGGFYPGDVFNNALFENPGHGNHFLALRLEGVTSNRAGYGARIEVVVATPTGTRSIHRAVGSVSSFGGSPARQEIGLGDAERVEVVRIRWPSGVTQEILDVPLDARVRVVEGRDGFER